MKKQIKTTHWSFLYQVMERLQLWMFPVEPSSDSWSTAAAGGEAEHRQRVAGSGSICGAPVDRGSGLPCQRPLGSHQQAEPKWCEEPPLSKLRENLLKSMLVFYLTLVCLQVTRAEGLLLQAQKKRKDADPLEAAALLKEVYDLLPHREPRPPEPSASFLSQKLDLCQVGVKTDLFIF